MKIPLLQHCYQTMQDLKRKQERHNTRLRSDEEGTKQTLNSSKDFQKGPDKVAVWVSKEEYLKYFKSPIEKLNGQK